MIPLVCRSCGKSVDTFPKKSDPPGLVKIVTSCYDCNCKNGHTQKVLVEYLDAKGIVIFSHDT